MDATPIEKTKYEVCQNILRYKRENNLSEKELAKKLGIKNQEGRIRSEMQNEGNDLRERTKDFALSVVRIFSALPKTTEAQILGR